MNPVGGINGFYVGKSPISQALGIDEKLSAKLDVLGTGCQKSPESTAALGKNVTASGNQTVAVGENVSITGGKSFGFGRQIYSNGNFSFSMGVNLSSLLGGSFESNVLFGRNARATNSRQFIWSASNNIYSPPDQTETFNVNPAKGISGFYIGKDNFVQCVLSAMSMVAFDPSL